MLAWAVSLGPDLFDLYTPGHGVVGTATAARAAGGWSPLGMVGGGVGVVVAYVALLLGAAGLILGFHSRLAALIVFAALVSFARRQSVRAQRR